MALSGHATFQIYLPLRLHFSTEQYDAFKYRMKCRGTDAKSYESRTDRFFFELIGSKLNNGVEAQRYFAAQFVEDTGTKQPVKILASGVSMQRYKNMMNRWDSLFYTVSSDINKMYEEIPHFNSWFDPVGVNGHEPIFKWMRAEFISFDTYLTMNYLTGFIKKRTDVNFIWSMGNFKAKKMTPFLASYINDSDGLKGQIVRYIMKKEETCQKS